MLTRFAFVAYFVACVLVLATRWVVTTQLDHFRADLINAFERTTGVEIHADEFVGSFHWFQPILTLNNVTLSRPNGPVSLHLKQVQAEFSWSSLFHLEPRFRNLVIRAPHLTVRRLDKDTLDVAGFTLALPSQQNIDKDQPLNAEQRFTAWLLAQDRIVLENGAFTYIDTRTPNLAPLSIHDAQAIFEKHFLEWRVGFQGVLSQGNHIVLKGTINKSIFSASDNPLTWSGQLYAQFDNVDVASVMRKLGFHDILKSGEGASRLWAHYDQGKITDLITDLAIRNVNAQLAPQLERFQLPSLIGRLHFKQNDTQKTATLTNLTLKTIQGESFGPANLSVACDHDSVNITGCEFGASELPIQTLLTFSGALPLPTDAQKFLKEHPISGTLRDIKIGFINDYQNIKNWMFDGWMTGLSFGQNDGSSFAFQNFSGRIHSSRTGQFNLTLDSHIFSLYWPEIFGNRRIDAKDLTGSIQATLATNAQISFDNIKLNNPDLSLQVSGMWNELSSDPAGQLMLTGKIFKAQANRIAHYLPNCIGKDVLNYVQDSVLAGQVSKGQVTVKGPLSQFPWDGAHKGTGQFLITGQLSKGVLDFEPSHRKDAQGRLITEENWPKLSNIKANLRFEGNRMLITHASATSKGVYAQNIQVEIPDYTAHPARVLVKSRLNGDHGAIIQYIKNTPFLVDILGSAVKQASGSGAVSADFDLNLPLEDGFATQFSLKTKLKDVSLRWAPTLPILTKINGQLLITDSILETINPLTARLDSTPFSASIKTQNHIASIQLNGNISGQQLGLLSKDNFTFPLQSELKGSTPVKIDIEIPLAKPADSDILVQTNFKGITSTLPAPFNKTKDQAWPTSIHWFFDDLNRRKLIFNLGDIANGQLIIAPSDNFILERGFIGIGVKPQPISDGVIVKANIENLDLNGWETVLERIHKRTSPTSSSSQGLTPTSVAAIPNSEAFSHFKEADLQITNLLVKDMVFNNIHTTVRHFDKLWHLRIASNQANGQIEYIPANETSLVSSFKLKFNKLYLPDMKTHRSTGDFDPTTVPNHVDITAATLQSSQAIDAIKKPQPQRLPIKGSELPNTDIIIDDLRVGKRHVGKLEFSAEQIQQVNGKDSWIIKRFAIYNVGGTLAGSGRWLEGQDQFHPGDTFLSLKADIKNMGHVLQSLDVNDVIHDTEGTIKAKLIWTGTPLDFNVASLNGDIHTRAYSGQFLQVEPGAGRILSLLSMQHLLRRLTLDFSDVISKGFSFDTLTSDAIFHNGIVKTSKATVTSSVATVVIGGDIDLVKEDLNMRALILPSINAEGASIALALANPAVGISTLIAQLVFKDQISKLFSTEYTITGPIDSPVVTRVNNKNQPSHTPATRKGTSLNASPTTPSQSVQDTPSPDQSSVQTQQDLKPASSVSGSGQKTTRSSTNTANPDNEAPKLRAVDF